LARELTDVAAVAEQVSLALTSYKIKLSAGSKWPHISKLETCHRMIAQCEGTATPYFARTHENTLSSIRSVLKTWHALLFQAVDDALRKALDPVAKLLNAHVQSAGCDILMDSQGPDVAPAAAAEAPGKHLSAGVCSLDVPLECLNEVNKAISPEAYLDFTLVLSQSKLTLAVLQEALPCLFGQSLAPTLADERMIRLAELAHEATSPEAKTASPYFLALQHTTAWKAWFKDVQSVLVDAALAQLAHSIATLHPCIVVAAGEETVFDSKLVCDFVP
jgi:hypothetical protein